MQPKPPLETALPRTLLSSETDRAVDVMTRAFFDDPLWCYLLPDKNRRASFMPRTYRPFLRYSIVGGRMFGVGAPARAVAIWSYPGQSPSNRLRLLRPDLLPVLFSPILPSFFRAFPIFGKFEEMQKAYAPERHYYLNTIAVEPEAQGQGLASQLMRPFLAQADARGMGTYTETMTPSNVGLYEYYGFRTMEEYKIPNTDLRLWGFYRAPQRSGGLV